VIRKYIHIIGLIFILLLCSVVQVVGQSYDYIWSLPLQYITNMQTLNPAYVGLWDKAGLFASTRINYVGISRAPVTQQFSYFTAIKDQKSGFGANIQQLNVGREKELILTGDYSYQIRLDMYDYLRFGFRGGVVNYSNNLTDYQLYPDLVTDPQFLIDVHNYFMTAFGLGALFYNENLYLSLSAPQIINNTFKVNQEWFSSVSQVKTVYLTGGYVFKLIGEMRLRPNILLVGTVGKPIYMDAAAILYLPENLQFGANIRSNGSFCLSGQYGFANNLRIGFAADYAVFQDIRKFQVGTYEILVGYDFNLYKRKYTKTHYF
jgi:type IX secretion system PorP/SprF family membrane protein